MTSPFSVRVMGRHTGAIAITLLGLLCGAFALPDVVSVPARIYGLGELGNVIVSPNGAYLASSGPAGAFLWDFEKRTVLYRLEAHRTVVMALAFSPDSRILLTGGRDGVIREWDTDGGAMLREHTGHGSEINLIAFSGDGLMFVSTSVDSSARLWSASSGDVLHTLSVPGQWINTAAFSPDGLLLATTDSSTTNNIRIWNTASGELLRTLGLHVGQVWKLSFLPDGRLASGGDDRKVRLWDVHTGDLIRALEGGPSIVNGLVATADKVIAGFDSGWISVWETETGVATKNMPTTRFWGMSAGSASGRVITANIDLVIREWDLATESITHEFEGHSTSTTLGLACSPDGTQLIAGGTEAYVRFWNRSTAMPAGTIDCGPGGTSAALLSADGRHLLTTVGSPAPELRLWNIATGELERDFGWTAGWPAAAAYSSDGSRVAAGTMNSEVHVFNVTTGARTTLTGHASPVRSIAFSPDGMLIASGDAAGAVRIWNAQNGQWQRTLNINAGWVTAVAFSPATNELMTASEDGFIHFWNPATGAQLRTIPVTGGFLEAAVYSPNGKYVLAGESWPFFVAELWHAASGELLRVFSGHSGSIKSVAFAADGMSAFTGADVIRQWDLSDLLLRLDSRRVATGIELRWEAGVLQRALTVDGPWNDVPNAASPWVHSIDDPSGFFRLRLPQN